MVGEQEMKRKLMILFMTIFFVCVYGAPVFAESSQLDDEIFYEIIVDRFNNGNYEIDYNIDVEDPAAYHGGDLEGITKKLDDLAEIGVTTLALSPIMANSDAGFHGYWIEDFKEIDEQFGTFEDLDELVTEAHNRDIKVVLEFVTNHVSENHPLVVDPEKSDWVDSESLEGPEWAEHAVKLNQDNPEVRGFMIDAASFWLEETGIDGLVLHGVDQSSLDFLEVFTKELKDRHEDFYLLGDILNSKTENVTEVLERTSLDAVDNYELGDIISEVFSEPDQAVSQIYEASTIAEEYPSIVGVDDKYSMRFTQKFAENKRNTLTAWKLALTYMYTTPGVPVILQGSEVGMYGDSAEDSQRLVPFGSGDPELKEFHDRVSSLRKQLPPLRHGDFELVDSADSMTVFKRSYEGQTVYIAINNGSESSYIDVPGIESDKMMRGYLEDNIVRINDEGNFRIGIPRESIEVYEVLDDVGINWLFISFVIGVMVTFVLGIIVLSIRSKKDEAKN